MSDGAESSVEVQWEAPNRPEMGTAPMTVTSDHDTGRFVTALVWTIRYGVHLVVASLLLLADLVPVFDVCAPRSFQIIDLTVGSSAVIVGCWVGGQTVGLTGDPQMMWLVDADLFDHDGVGIYICSMPWWSEQTVVDG